MSTLILRAAATAERWPLPRPWRSHLRDCLRAFILDGTDIHFGHVVGLRLLPRHDLEEGPSVL